MNFFKKLCIINIFIFLNIYFLPSAYALDGKFAISDFRHDKWGTKEGAPALIMGMVQTTDGWIWIATYQGLYRFDGQKFERFIPEPGESLTFDIISSLSTAPNGDLIIGYLTGGASVLHNGHLRHLTSVQNQQFSNTFTVLPDVDGTYWAGALDGFMHFDGKKWERIDEKWDYPGTKTDNIVVDRFGRMFVSDGENLYILDRGRKKFIPTGLRSAANDADLIFDSRGNLWIGADDTLTQIPPPKDGLPNANIDVKALVGMHRLFDKDGNLWLNYDDKICMIASERLPTSGVISTKESNVLTNCTAKRGPSDRAQMMMEDHDGNIWIATEDGIERFRHNRFRAILYPVPASRAAIIRDKSGTVTVVVGNPASRFILDGTVMRKLDDQHEPILFQRPGIGATMLLATPTTLIVRGPEGERRIPYPVPSPKSNDRVGRLIQEDTNTFWVAWSIHGLWRYSDGIWTKPPYDGQFVARSNAASDSRGHVWFAYANNLIVELGRGYKRRYDSRDGIRVRVVTFLNFERETLIGGDGGLQVLIGNRFRDIRAADPNALTGINGLVIAPNGDRWFNTRNGVLHVKERDWTAVMRDPSTLLLYEVLDQLDGFRGPQLGTVATSAVAPDGRMWFAASGSVALYDPLYDHPTITPPPPFILAISSDNKAYSPSQSIQMEPGTDRVDIRFTALSYTIPERTVFRYRLEGFETKWQSPISTRNISYAGLRPGKYRFALQAALHGGAWNSQTAYKEFEIAPSFTQTWWFTALCGFTFLVVATLIYRMRVQHITRRLREQDEARQHERERIARELHDTVLQVNFALLLQIRAAAATAIAPLAERLEKIVTQGQSALAEGRDKVAGLRGENSSYNNFEETARRQAAEILHSSDIILCWHYNGKGWIISPRVAAECLAIMTEAVTNARNHAQPKHVIIRVNFGILSCRIVISDDGCGIPPAHLAGRVGHWGMQGMRERADLIKARLDIASNTKGTTVTLRLLRWHFV